MISASSRIRMNFPRIRQLEAAQVKALEQTAEADTEEMTADELLPHSFELAGE